MPMELVMTVPAEGASAVFRSSGGAAADRRPRLNAPTHTRTSRPVRFMSPYPCGQVPRPEPDDEYQRAPRDNRCQARPHSPDVDVIERPPQKQDRGAEHDRGEPAGDCTRCGAPC